MQQDTYLAVGEKGTPDAYNTLKFYNSYAEKKNTVHLLYCFTLILKHPIKVIADQWFPKDRQELKARREDSLIA